MTGPPGHPTISRQPLNALFRILYVGVTVARLPVWLFVAFFATPNPKWSAKQTLLCRVAKAVLDLRSRIGITETTTLKPGREGSRFQVIQPFSKELYKGPLSSSSVSSEAVGGTWSPEAPGKDISSKTVALYIHGGAFVIYDGREETCGFACKTLTANDISGVDAVLSLQYRLSGYGGRSPFPAALQDTLTAYLYLLRTLEIPPRQIVLCGDSAGANLVIALTRYIHEFGSPDIPLPKCVALFSPWVSPLDYDVSNSPRSKSDYLPTSFLQWGAVTYTSGVSDASSNPYIVPLGHPFATSVPIFVNVGTDEIFLGDVGKWAEEMKAFEGNQVEVHLEDSGIHDTLLAGASMGFEQSAQNVVTQMGAFIHKF